MFPQQAPANPLQAAMGDPRLLAMLQQQQGPPGPPVMPGGPLPGMSGPGGPPPGMMGPGMPPLGAPGMPPGMGAPPMGPQPMNPMMMNPMMQQVMGQHDMRGTLLQNAAHMLQAYVQLTPIGMEQERASQLLQEVETLLAGHTAPPSGPIHGPVTMPEPPPQAADSQDMDGAFGGGGGIPGGPGEPHEPPPPHGLEEMLPP